MIKQKIDFVCVFGNIMDHDSDKLFLFSNDQAVGGTVEVIMPGNVRKIEHTGIKAELIGQIQLAYDRGNHYIFYSTVKELEGPGILSQDKTFKFEFNEKDNKDGKKYESYDGINVRLRYFVRVRITRNYGGSISKEFDFAVQVMCIFLLSRVDCCVLSFIFFDSCCVFPLF